MATRYGYQILLWLKDRGWKEIELEEDVIGDAHVIHPQDLQPMSVYEAAKIHEKHTGESCPYV